MTFSSRIQLFYTQSAFLYLSLQSAVCILYQSAFCTRSAVCSLHFVLTAYKMIVKRQIKIKVELYLQTGVTCTIVYSTISISPNRNNQPNNKIKRGNLRLQYAYHYNVKIKQKIPSQLRTSEERMDKENSSSLKC